MPIPSRVLIVDRSTENQEILGTLLRRGGIRTWTLGDVEQASLTAGRISPDLIVLDGDSDVTPNQALSVRLGEIASRKDIPIVVLGTKNRRNRTLPASHSVSKPYHYGPLLRKIEELLEARFEGGRTQ